MRLNTRRLITLATCLALSSPAAGAIETRAAVEPVVTAPDEADLTAGAAADDPGRRAPQPDAQGLATADPPVYVPPRRGAPKTRVGGGTRSGGEQVHLALLAPEHTGLTRSPSPTLYWWLSADHPGPVEVVVTAENGVTPVLRLRPPAPVAAGIHAVDLTAAGLTLEAGVPYRWSVAIIRDENARSRDVVATATLEYLPPERAVSADAGALAAAGLWYDAMAALNRDAEPGRQAALLEQVDLDEVARWILDSEGSARIP